MSETVKKRTVQEIQMEYANLCTKAGHAQYQLFTIKRDLDLINETLRDLNQEAFTAQQKEKEEAEAAAKNEEVSK